VAVKKWELTRSTAGGLKAEGVEGRLASDIFNTIGQMIGQRLGGGRSSARKQALEKCKKLLENMNESEPGRWKVLGCLHSKHMVLKGGGTAEEKGKYTERDRVCGGDAEVRKEETKRVGLDQG